MSSSSTIMDAAGPDSAVSSIPQSPSLSQSPPEAPLRLMCSVGGRILPRPHDNQLRYVGGDTRIVAVQRNSAYSTLHSKLSKLAESPDVAIKYQLPNEDLDALISVTGDEDVENMMEEYDRLVASAGVGRTPRLRLFIFPADEDCPVGFGSILDGSGSKRDSWFLDVLNGTGSGRLQRGQSDASSLLSEVPDYLSGVDNYSSKLNASETGSPGPAPYSPKYSSTSSVTAPPADIQPVKPEVSQYIPNPAWRYTQEPVPVYYMPPSVGSGNMQVRPGPVQYFNPVQPAPMYRPSTPVQGVWSNPGHPVYVGGPPPQMGYDYRVAPQTYEVAGSGGEVLRSPGSGIGPVGGELGGVVVMGRGSQN